MTEVFSSQIIIRRYSTSETVQTPYINGLNVRSLLYKPSGGFYNKETNIIQNPISVIQRNNNIRKRIEIRAKLDTAWKENTLFLQKWNFTFINNLFQAITIELANLGIQNIVVETTLDDSILIKSNFHDKRLYVELFLTEDETPLNYDIVINIYENQKHIFGTAGSVKNTFTKINQFLM
jgi:hypothetical protein